jgi:hypothetical protein
MVSDGRMPRPKVINSRRAWDVRQLDQAVDDLPIDGEQTNKQGDDSSWGDVDAAKTVTAVR